MHIINHSYLTLSQQLKACENRNKNSKYTYYTILSDNQFNQLQGEWFIFQVI